MQSWSWLALPILAAIVVLMWLAQERQPRPLRHQSCPAGQVSVPTSGYGPSGCVISGETKP